MKTVTLEIDDSPTCEHELFRACMQSVVALEQDGWSRKAQKEQAQRLRIVAHKYVATEHFKNVDCNAPDQMRGMGFFRWYEVDKKCQD